MFVYTQNTRFCSAHLVGLKAVPDITLIVSNQTVQDFGGEFSFGDEWFRIDIKITLTDLHQ